MHYHTHDLISNTKHVHETEEELRQYLLSCGIVAYRLSDARAANMIVELCSEENCLETE